MLIFLGRWLRPFVYHPIGRPMPANPSRLPLGYGWSLLTPPTPHRCLSHTTRWMDDVFFLDGSYRSRKNIRRAGRSYFFRYISIYIELGLLVVVVNC